MKISLASVAAIVASATAVDIKERLRHLRDPENVNTVNVMRFLNDRHELRIQKLAELLDDRQRKLQDHNAGHRMLSSEEHAHVTRQASNFERKLTQLKNVDPSEHADMLQHEAEALFKMNSVDYLDFELKN